MGFILDGLESESYDRQYRDRDLLARILAYFLPQRRAVAAIPAALTLNSLAGSGAPIAIARAIDAVAAEPRVARLFLAGGLVLLLGVVGLTGKLRPASDLGP